VVSRAVACCLTTSKCLACKEDEHIRRQRPRSAQGQSILDKYSFIITPIEASPVTYCTSPHCYLRSADPTARFTILLSPFTLQPQVGRFLSENEPRNEGILEEFFALSPTCSPSVQGQLKQFQFVCRGKGTSQRGRRKSRVKSRSRLESQAKPSGIHHLPHLPHWSCRI
jgi:hypothetical protein